MSCTTLELVLVRPRVIDRRKDRLRERDRPGQITRNQTHSLAPATRLRLWKFSSRSGCQWKTPATRCCPQPSSDTTSKRTGGNTPCTLFTATRKDVWDLMRNPSYCSSSSTGKEGNRCLCFDETAATTLVVVAAPAAVVLAEASAATARACTEGERAVSHCPAGYYEWGIFNCLAASLPQVPFSLTFLLSGCKAFFVRFGFPGACGGCGCAGGGLVYAGVMKSAFTFARLFIFILFYFKKTLDFFSTVTSAGLDSFGFFFLYLRDGVFLCLFFSLFFLVFSVWKSGLGDLFGFLFFFFFLPPLSIILASLHLPIPSHRIPKCQAFAASFLSLLPSLLKTCRRETGRNWGG